MEASLSHIAGSAKLPDRLFRILADTTSVGIAVYALDRVMYANPAMEAITGYGAAELLSMSPLDPVHPDDREEVGAKLAERLRGGRPPGERFEVRFRGKEGGDRHIEVTSSRIEWRGEPAALATIVDLTERRRAEMALREERERFDLAQSAARYVTWEWNLETDELLVDDRVAEIFGVALEEVGGNGSDFLRRLIHPEDRGRLRDVLRAARDEPGADKVAAEVRFLLPDGRTGWIGERARLLPAGDGKPRRIIGVATDITERKEAEIELAEEKERALVTLASIGDGVIRTDREGRIDYMNPVAERLTGWSLEQALGRPLMEVYRVIDEGSRKPLADPLQVCLGQRRVVELPGNSILLHRDGRDYAIQDSAAPVVTRDGRLTGAVLVFKDVTHIRGMEQEVSYLATHDPLTGLVNRHEFERRVERLLDRAPGVELAAALCYLDLDEFKLINDTCGHLAGDQLLQQLAERLQEQVAPGDTVARLGGDEFGVLFENVTPEEARERTQQAKELVTTFRFEWEDRLFTLGVSVGLVLLHAGGTAAELMSAADAACYLAKEEGRNRVHEHQPDDERLARRYGEMHWIHRIHKAFEDERFCLFVQRIEPLGSAEPLAEVFIRMRDPEGELITPGHFIPAAERFHLIPAIDRWVTREAFRRLAVGGHGLGEDTSFAINISGQSLGEEGFLRDVVGELEASGIDPRRLCFEITETAAVTHLNRANRFIGVLRGYGCRFILDDFGSGLSSFAYLKNLQVDFLKVSGDFVRGVAGNEVQWALARSIHELGRLMGMRTIAEGVETDRDVEAVREIGFDYAQGYFFDRPGPL